MSTQNATTFRFSEETRAELERLKGEFQAPTLQKTLELLILTHSRKDNELRNAKASDRISRTKLLIAKNRISAFNQALKGLTEIETEFEEGGGHG